MADKKDLILIAFVLMSGILAVYFISQTSTEVFRQGEVIDQAFILQHEDEARLNQTLHEDKARDLQFEKENEARDKQRYQIVKETNKSVNDSIVALEERLYKFMNESEQRADIASKERAKLADDSQKRAEIANKERDMMAANVKNITYEVLNLSKGLDAITRENLELDKQNLKGVLEHRTQSEQHHEKMLEMIENITKIN